MVSPLRRLILVSDLASLGSVNMTGWIVNRVTSWLDASDLVVKDIPDQIIGHISTSKDQVFDFLNTFSGFPPCPLGVIMEKEEADQGILCLSKGASDCFFRESLTPDTWETLVNRSFIQGSLRQRDRLSHKILETRLELSDFASKHSLDELLTATLDVTESLTGSTIGFFHFFDEEAGTILLHSWSTRTKNYFCRAEGQGSHYDVEKAGIWVDCVRERRPVVHNNYDEVPHKKGLPPGHARVVRELTVPILRDNKVVAVLGVGNKPSNYGSQDVEIVLQLADLAWDISERKRREADSKIWMARLQERKRRESLGTMAAGVAHDFNNFLSAIYGYTDLIKAELPMDHSAYGYFTPIEKTINKAADLCRQMLASTGRGKIWVQPLVLTAQLKEMEGWIRAQVPRHLALTWDIEPQVPPVEVDQNQLRQAIMNLLNNSVESLEDKPGSIRIRCSWSELTSKFRKTHPDIDPVTFARGVVWIEIEDTGHGIPPDNLEKSFEPFVTTKFLGRGLGLPAVLGIMEAHRGTVKLESVPGEGTKVTLFFPICEGQYKAELSPLGPTDQTHTGALILLADDEEILRESTGVLLELMGYQVLMARDGKEAIELFKANQTEIKLCILDFTMPIMDGAEALQEIRKVAPGTRILITSGYAQNDIQEKTGTEKPDGFLSKPFNRQDLEDLVRKYLPLKS